MHTKKIISGLLNFGNFLVSQDKIEPDYTCKNNIYNILKNRISNKTYEDRKAIIANMGDYNKKFLSNPHEETLIEVSDKNLFLEEIGSWRLISFWIYPNEQEFEKIIKLYDRNPSTRMNIKQLTQYKSDLCICITGVIVEKSNHKTESLTFTLVQLDNIFFFLLKQVYLN